RALDVGAPPLPTQPRLLHHVLGARHVAEHAIGEREQRGTMRLEAGVARRLHDALLVASTPATQSSHHAHSAAAISSGASSWMKWLAAGSRTVRWLGKSSSKR